MRSGKLDRVITIQANTITGYDDYGTPIFDWSDVATVRSQVVQSSTEEYFQAYGESHQTAVIFRLRYLAEVTTDHRVEFDGKHFNIREISEIGRRSGLELRAEAFE